MKKQAERALRTVGLYHPVRKLLGREDAPFSGFVCEDASNVNQARMEHLGSLGLDLSEKKVIEVGCGIGLLTEWFERQKCVVESSDARPANVAENLRLHPWRSVAAVDLDIVDSLGRTGAFQVAFCYGTLYHLRRPRHALELLSAEAPLLLLETCVSLGSDLSENLLPEDKFHETQAQGGIGCRPTRSWVMHQLGELWGHAYVTVTQPDHQEFPLDWTEAPSPGRLTRSVFVASREPLDDNPALSRHLEDKQPRFLG